MKLSKTYTLYPFFIKREYSFLWSLLRKVSEAPFYISHQKNIDIDPTPKILHLTPLENGVCTFSNLNEKVIKTEGVSLHLLKSFARYKVTLSNVTSNVRFYTRNSRIDISKLTPCLNFEGEVCEYSSNESFSIQSINYIVVMSDKPLTITLEEELIERVWKCSSKIYLSTNNSRELIARRIKSESLYTYKLSDEFMEMKSNYLNHLRSLSLVLPNTHLLKSILPLVNVKLTLFNDSVIETSHVFRPDVQHDPYRTYFTRNRFLGIRLGFNQRCKIIVNSLRFTDKSGNDVDGLWMFSIVRENGESLSHSEKELLMSNNGYKSKEFVVKEQSFSFMITNAKGGEDTYKIDYDITVDVN